MNSTSKYIVFLVISKRNNLKVRDCFNFFTIDCKNRKLLNNTKNYHTINSFMTKQQYLKLYNNSSNIKEFDETLKTGFLKYLNYDITYLMDVNHIFNNTDKINVIYINTRFYFKPIIETKEKNPFYDPNKKEYPKQKYQQIWLDSEKVIMKNRKPFLWGKLSDKVNENAYQKELKQCEGIMLYDYRTSYQIKQEEKENKYKEVVSKLYNSYDEEFPLLKENKQEENKQEKEELKQENNVQKDIKPEISINKLTFNSPIPLKNKFNVL